ncbi:MAG: InlB B-repeat-containing protein, partial [Candidatus Omnitrophica bacterium]|nr:InlB B-repeat-containing protein [Candidatus Omnitrophota bacterium]
MYTTQSFRFRPVARNCGWISFFILIVGLAVAGPPGLYGQSLPTPTGVSASDGLYDNMIQIEWNADASLWQFEVWRNTSSDRTGAQLTSTDWWNWYLDYEVIPGQTYYYWIRGTDGINYSDFSTPDSGYASQSATDRYTLAINAGSNGRVLKSLQQDDFAANTEVILTALPDQGYEFAGWSGDLTGTQNPATIRMTKNMVINAAFRLISVSQGSITILINPQEAVTAGAQWRIQGENTWRSSGATFTTDTFKTYIIEFKPVSGWTEPSNLSVPLASNMPNITWTVDYTQGGEGYTLSTQSDHGSILRNPDKSLYQCTDQVQLTASPDSGYQFSHWSGDAQGTNNPITILMDDNKTVQAVFEPSTAPNVIAEHAAGNYQSPGTLIVQGKVTYASNNKLLSLKWTPQLPSGWQLAGASGAGSPEIQQGEIVWTSSLSNNPIEFTYTVQVPSQQDGAKAIRGSVEYQLMGMINPSQIAVQPDPLTVNLITYHTADYRDPRWSIDGTEVNRGLSYWRAGAYHLESQGADGYAPGSGNTGGARHAADYREPYWVIDGTEVNRLLSYWRAGGYHVEPLGADGFAPGTTSPSLHGLQTSSDPAIQQTGPDQYTPGGTVNITNSISYNGMLLALLWRPQLPEGWTITQVTGTSSPEMQGSEIVFLGALTENPITMVYTVSVPSGSQGAKSVRGEVEYQLPGQALGNHLAAAERSAGNGNDG